MGVMVSHITSLTIVYSTVNSGANQSKRQSSRSLPFLWGIHRWPVNSTHKWSVTRDMIPFDDVIMLEWYDLHDDVMAWKRISGFVSEGIDCWIPVTKRRVMSGFDIFFDVSFNKLSNNQLSCRWSEIMWCSYGVILKQYFNKLKLGQGRLNFCRRNFQMHFMGWRFVILFQTSPKFVHEGPINTKAALVHEPILD